MCKLAAQSYPQQQCQPGIAAGFHFVCVTQLRLSFRIHATGTAGRAFCCGVILIAEEFCITPRRRLMSNKIEQAPASVTLCFACASVIHSCCAPLFSLCPNNILPFSLTDLHPREQRSLTFFMGSETEAIMVVRLLRVLRARP